MKKLICVILAFAMICSFVACGKDETVTIYIPEFVTVYTKESLQASTVIEYVYEDGWQDKESFTVAYRTRYNTSLNLITMIYGDKCEISEVKNTSKTATYYDENGRVIRRINEYEYVVNDMEKHEVTYTYDENGRMLTQQTQTYYTDREEPVVQTTNYSYRETEQGSEGSATVGDMTEVLVYDKQYRLVRTSQTSNAGEITYTEREYDERGNQISIASYLNGELISKSVTTYIAVQVSQETAARLPQFVTESKRFFFDLFG